MNRIFNIVYSATQNCLVVCSELAKGRKKTKSTSRQNTVSQLSTNPQKPTHNSIAFKYSFLALVVSFLMSGTIMSSTAFAAETVDAKDKEETKIERTEKIKDEDTSNIANVVAEKYGTDAVNLKQLTELLGSVSVGEASNPNIYFHVNTGDLNQEKGDPDTNSGPIDSKAGAVGTFSVAAGVEAQAKGNNNTVIGSKSSTFESRLVGKIEDFTFDGNENPVERTTENISILGANNKVTGESATVVGYQNEVKEGYFNRYPIGWNMNLGHEFQLDLKKNVFNAYETVLGSENEVNGHATVVIGYNNTISGEDSFKDGSRERKTPQIGGNYSIGIGYETESKGLYNLVAGYKATANGSSNVVLGDEAHSAMAGSIVIGQKARTYESEYKVPGPSYNMDERDGFSQEARELKKYLHGSVIIGNRARAGIEKETNNYDGGKYEGGSDSDFIYKNQYAVNLPGSGIAVGSDSAVYGSRPGISLGYNAKSYTELKDDSMFFDLDYAAAGWGSYTSAISIGNFSRARNGIAVGTQAKVLLKKNRFIDGDLPKRGEYVTALAVGDRSLAEQIGVVSLGYEAGISDLIELDSLSTSEFGDFDVNYGRDSERYHQRSARQAKDSVYIGTQAGAYGYHQDKTRYSEEKGNVDDAPASIFIGKKAGFNIQGESNLGIGEKANYNVLGSENINIGKGARVSVEADQDYRLGEITWPKRYGTAGSRNIILGNHIITSASEENDLTGNKNAINDTIAIGNITKAIGNASIALGSSKTQGEAGALAEGDRSIAIGGKYTQSNKDREFDVYELIGKGSLQRSGARARGEDAIAFGTSAHTNGKNSVSIGTLTGFMSEGDENISLGTRANVNHTGSQNISIGSMARAGKKLEGFFNNNSTFTMETYGDRNIVLGNQILEEYPLEGSPMDGHPSDDHSIDSYDNPSKLNDSIAIGNIAKAFANQSIAIGSSRTPRVAGAYAEGERSIAIGVSADPKHLGAFATGKDAVALGTNAKVGKETGVAIGAFSLSDREAAKKEDAFVYGDKADAQFIQGVKDTVVGRFGAISVGNAENTRQIINVAAGSLDTDAVNVAQLRQVASQVSGYVHVNDGDKNQGVGDPNTNFGSVRDKAGATGKYSVTVGIDAKAHGENSMAMGHGAIVNSRGSMAFGLGATVEGVDLGDGIQYGPVYETVVIGNRAVAKVKDNGNGTYTGAEDTIVLGNDAIAEAAAQHAIIIGSEATSKSSSSVTIGQKAKGTGSEKVVAIGFEAEVTEKQGTAIGAHSKAGDLSSAFGFKAEASGSQSIAMGHKTTATAIGATAVGTQTHVSKEYGAAFGTTANVSGDYGAAFGPAAKVEAERGAAIGANTKVTHAHSVALGSFAESVEAESISEAKVGELNLKFAGANSDTSAVFGSVSIGNYVTGGEFTRQIKHVAPGAVTETSTDAINGSQLYSVADELNKKITDNIGGGGSLTFIGDDSQNIVKNLGDTLPIFGGLESKVIIGDDKVPTVTPIDALVTEGNIAVVKSSKDGKDGLEIKLAKNLSGLETVIVGEAGKDGADGSSVVISGKDGISITGPKGKDGKDGISADINIAVGEPGLNGKDGITRIVYKDKDEEYEVATLDDGLNFVGDDGKVVSKKLNETLNIIGGINEKTVSNADGTTTTLSISDQVSENNIAIVEEDVLNAAGELSDKRLVVKLAKNIDLGKDGTITTGNTVINNNGLTINNAGPKGKGTISITNNSVNMGGNKITNVAKGDVSETSTDAINGSQLHEAISNINVSGGGRVVKSTDGTVSVDDTDPTAYDLSVSVNGNIVDGDTGAVSGDTVYKYLTDNHYNQTTINKMFAEQEISYRANSTGTHKSVKLSDGLNFTSDKYLAASVKDNGEVTYGLSQHTIDILEKINNIENGGDSGDTVVTGDLTYKANGKNEKVVTLEDGLDFLNGNYTIASVADKGQVTIDIDAEKAKADIIKVIKENTVITDGADVNFGGDDNITVKTEGNNVSISLNSELKNINQISNGDTHITIKEDKSVDFGDSNLTNVESISNGDTKVTINEDHSIDVGDSVIKNVTDGEISETSTEAINGSQLYKFKADIDNKLNQFDKEDKNLRAGVAGAHAAIALPQVNRAGKSMISAATGTYRGQNALAVGFSRMSDNGKFIFKVHGNTDSRGKFAAGAGVGYQW